MYRNKKTFPLLLALLLLICLLPFSALAADGITCSVEKEGSNITITGVTFPNSPVSLVVTRTTDGSKGYLDQTVTNAEGDYFFRFALGEGNYRATVSCYGLHKQVDIQTKSSQAETVTVRVEGKTATKLPQTEVDIIARETTLLDAIINALDSSNVKYELINGLIHTIDGDEGWQWMINGRGGMHLPTDVLTGGEEIVLIDGTIWDPVITRLAVAPASVQVGDTFTAVLRGAEGKPLVGQPVVFSGETKITDNEGRATFTPTKEGTYKITANTTGSLIRPVPVQINVTSKGGGGGTTPPAAKTVTVSVEKRSIGEGDILRPTKVTLVEGDTAFTVIKRLLGDKVQYRGSGSGLYVEAIDGLREFDRGPGSGWMYCVNGWFPNYSAGIYNLKDGDVLRWQYTTNLGEDIGGDGAINPATDEEIAALKSKIAAAKALDQNQYTPASWAMLQQKLAQAEEISRIKTPGKGSVQRALMALQEAIDNLVKRGDENKVDKSKLTAKIAEVEKLKETDYTADSWSIFKEKLATAQAVMIDNEADQATVDQALGALTEAINNLVKKGQDPSVADKTALQAKIAAAEKLNQAEYTSDSWSKLTTALQTAKAVIVNDKATQAEIENALNALEAAINNLKPKQLTPNQLSNLTISNGILSPAFKPDTTNYTAGVTNNISTITVTPTVAYTQATVQINGKTVTSGQPPNAIDLKVGANTITILVTAPDGTTKTYTITVTRNSSSGGGGGGGGGSSSRTTTTTSETSQNIRAASGGSINNAEATVIVPAGALTYDTTLKIAKLSASQTDQIVTPGMRTNLASGIYDITTTGSQHFGQKTITIKIAYDTTKINQDMQPVIKYLDEKTNQWIPLPTKAEQDTSGKWHAVTQVNHLTKFAVFDEPIKQQIDEQKTQPKPEQTPTATKQITLTINQKTVHINGQQHQLDAAPIVDTKANRVLIPIRFVSEALGANVNWDGNKRQITIKHDTKEIIMTLDSVNVITNGQNITIDSAPKAIPPGRTFVPLRFVSENLGAGVEYDSASKQITIKH